MKILLVEDNVSLCRNIASVLQNEGYTVVTCSNGNEAEFQIVRNVSYYAFGSRAVILP